jgi:hypothetical protein
MGAEAEAPEAEAEADTDLADEHEHVERAGLGQVHHKGAVEDGQAAAPASSNHGACAGHNLVPQQQCNTKQMASKLATSSSSNAAVGEKVACSTMEPMSPHASPPRAARAIDRSGISPSRDIYYLSIYLSIIYLPTAVGGALELRAVIHRNTTPSTRARTPGQWSYAAS